MQANKNENLTSTQQTVVRAKRVKGVITTVEVNHVETGSVHDNNYHKAAAEYFLFIAEMGINQMRQPAHELRTRIFEETEAIALNVTSERLPDEIPASNDAAYQAGYEDALMDAKIYFRMLITRLLGEEQ